MTSESKIVAIVDDEIDITTLFHNVLCENVLEASVYAFNDPVNALKHFTENESNYALIISDLRMPVLNGLELLKKVKVPNPKVRTILMSAYNVGEDTTIDKPVTINKLCQRVKDELNALACIRVSK